MRESISILRDWRQRLIGRQWYHQRFDGCPMFMFPIAEAEVRRERRKPSGTEADLRVCFFDHGQADWYLSQDDIQRGANRMVSLARRDPKISGKLLAAWRADEKAFTQFGNQFPRINLPSLSDAALRKLWSRYCRLFVNRVTSSAIIDHFALGTDQYIHDLLEREVRQRWPERLIPESELTAMFATATAPVRQSFINQAEAELLKIALGRSRQNLGQHQRRYFWTRNNYYLAQELTVEHFAEEVAAWQSSGEDLAGQLRSIEQTPLRARQRKAKLFSELRPSPLLRALLKISEDFAWWQDERKRATYLNIHLGAKLLQEVAGRIGYELDELKYALPPEMDALLGKRRPARLVLRQRRERSAFVATRDGYAILRGAAAERLQSQVLGQRSAALVNDFRGLSACLGRAIGPARIIRSATEIGRVREGDVLVAVMTRPDYVAGMKKAAAIVTDEGGITSHAAIVARELSKPCIIGTKIATEVLHDGDLVEVNANHGWVRKLEQPKTS